MNRPLISIIVPFYNTESYLRRCLESISAQTYRNLEVILVNDGSGDSSAAIAEAFEKADSRFKVISISNSGVSAARNTGLSAATGEYVMFVDSDDWIALEIIEQMMKVREETDADIVTCDLARVDNSDNLQNEKIVSLSLDHDPSHENSEEPSPEAHVLYTKDEYMRLFFKINSNEWVHFPVAKIYKRSLLPNDLYPENIRVGEDVLGTYRAIEKAETVARLREVGYFYFANPESATSSFNDRDFDLITVWDKMVAITEGTEPDHEYAVLNRNRINFTLLFRLITEVPLKERKQKYSEQQKQLLSDLRKCKKDLLHSPIVRSRKILVFLLCHFFPLMSVGGSLYVLAGKVLGPKVVVTAQRRTLS